MGMAVNISGYVVKNARVVALKNLYDTPFIIWQGSHGSIIDIKKDEFIASFKISGKFHEYKLRNEDYGVLWDFYRYQPMSIFGI